MVRWGKLTGKFMPRLYSPSVQVFFDRLWRAEGSRYLRELIANGAYGVLPPGDSYSPELPIKFVRSAELKPSLDIDLDSCPQVAQEYFVPKARARKDDVLLAVKGATIASNKSVAHVKEDIGDAVVNGSIFRMQAKTGVNARFLAIALSTEFAKRQMKLALVANNGVDYLDKTLIHKLVIPTPGIEKQKQLVARYDAATTKSQEFTQKADALLASIDDYLLSELGIVLPPEPESTIANRMFRTNAHELGGWRFDPDYFQQRFQQLDHAITYGRFEITALRQLIMLLVNGFDCRDFVEEGIPYVKVAQVKPFNIKVLDADRIPINGVPKRGIAQKNDLLLTRKGSFGIAALNTSDEPFAFSSEVFRLRFATQKILPEFAEIVLNSKILRMQFDRHAIGAIMGSLTQAVFGKIAIPLPPIAIQQAIVSEAAQRRRVACSIQAEANAELEKAKREIEAILLGNAA